MTEVYNDIYAPITAEQMANIPEEMKAAARWICWGSEKVPASVAASMNGNHYGIDIVNAANWGTFEQAAAAIGQPAYVKSADEYFHIVGIGFVAGDGWFCADLDGGPGHGRENVPDEAITDALNVMQTYAEKSVSGCGYHVFGKCDFSTTDAEHNEPHRGPDGEPVLKSYEVEFFTRRKFIAITGRKLPGSSASAKDCHAAAKDFYTRYILNDWKRDEAKRAAERAKVAASIPVNADAATEMFMKEYPEILAKSDSSNFKRGGPGAKLAPGEYSWIAAVKSMQEIGIPESAIMDWCRKGSNFKSEKDVIKVLSKSSKPGAASVGGIIEDAKAHGWKPKPENLTGKYKANHEAAEAWKAEQGRKEAEYKAFRESHREEHAAALAAIGIDCAGDPYRYTWKLDFDGSIAEVTETETGEIVYTKPAAQEPAEPERLPTGEAVYPANPAAAEPATPDPAAPWKPIVRRDPLPVFPLEKLPGWIKDYIDNFSANTGISKDFCAACILGAVSTVICGRLQINFNGTHYEPAQLYTVFVGRSGSMKSTSVKQFVGPARAWMIEKNKSIKSHNDGILSEITNLEKELQKERKKSRNDDTSTGSRAAEIAAQIEQRKESIKPEYPEPWTDITPEYIPYTAQKTNGITTIATAEGNIVNVLTGRSYSKQGNTPNLDIFLSGYDGEPYKGGRVTSGEITLPRVDISILIAIQPSLLETLCHSPDANSRGLVPRFLIFSPDETGAFIDHTKPNNTDFDLVARWNKHIRAIAENIMKPDAPNLVTMQLHMMADRIIRELWNYSDELLKQRGETDEDGVSGFISKLHGKALRLAAILALLNDPNAKTITDEDAQTAVDLLKDYFLPHYMCAFSSEDNLSKEARKIVTWIKKRATSTGNLEYFTDRDLHQYARQLNAFKGRLGAETFRNTLADLIDRNYIRQGVPEKTPSGRGRPSPTWQINPALFTR